MIKIKNVSKSFADKEVLKNINLDISDGEIIGLVGESGIGKSTLAKILCGVISPDKGEIYYKDNLLVSNICKFDRKIGIKIQMVYQQPFSVLDPSQRIVRGFKELIKYHHICDKKDINRYIEEITKEVELLPDIILHLPHQISGGEAQRIAIAKCLMLQPKLIILDEATSMLDVSTQANVLSLIKKKVTSYGGSILMISHDEKLVKNYCNKLYEIKEKELRRI